MFPSISMVAALPPGSTISSPSSPTLMSSPSPSMSSGHSPRLRSMWSDKDRRSVPAATFDALPEEGSEELKTYLFGAEDPSGRGFIHQLTFQIQALGGINHQDTLSPNQKESPPPEPQTPLPPQPTTNSNNNSTTQTHTPPSATATAQQQLSTYMETSSSSPATWATTLATPASSPSTFRARPSRR